MRNQAQNKKMYQWCILWHWLGWQLYTDRQPMYFEYQPVHVANQKYPSFHILISCLLICNLKWNKFIWLSKFRYENINFWIMQIPISCYQYLKQNIKYLKSNDKSYTLQNENLFNLILYSRDGSSYHLSDIILYFLYYMHSTLNFQNIDIFLCTYVVPI